MREPLPDRTYDRVVSFDERSRQFPVRTLIEATKPRSYTWRSPVHLDQGREGSCVGHGWAHQVGSSPKGQPALATSALALALYHEAQTMDEWPGEDYSGSSVLGGAKATLSRGYISQYRWAFGLDDALLAISRKGPAVLGINWYAGMEDPDSKGLLHASGELKGGHCVLAVGVSLSRKAVRLHNSWGTGWGIGGDAYLPFEDLGRLLAESGECCIPVR